MDLERFFGGELDAHLGAVSAARALYPSFRAFHDAMAETVRGGSKILLFGNGGSAACAQHIAAELAVRYRRDRAPIAAIALGADGVMLTAAANDMGFDEVFAREVAALARPGDLVIGLTTSGRSANVRRGLAAAREAGARSAAMTGEGGEDLAAIADPLLLAPARETARIQEAHLLFGHMLCAALERSLGLAGGRL